MWVSQVWLSVWHSKFRCYAALSCNLFVNFCSLLNVKAMTCMKACLKRFYSGWSCTTRIRQYHEGNITRFFLKTWLLCWVIEHFLRNKANSNNFWSIKMPERRIWRPVFFVPDSIWKKQRDLPSLIYLSNNIPWYFYLARMGAEASLIFETEWWF